MNTSLTTFVRTLLAALLFAFAGHALAIDTEKAFDDPALQARYEHINRELRCLVCQNQTIADSNATLAQDLRREVREMITAGRTDDEIREFMIARYGDFVLYRPRMTAGNFLLWAAPVLLLLLGGFIGIRYVRRQAAEIDADRPEAGQS
ncbi:MAG TPA: cytochrome c-type biogenesis protein [Steroidobacteraceae bacterium]|nr:cytochrome c-type biogenesis protein [Steroidobacteraceae bacterium]